MLKKLLSLSGVVTASLIGLGSLFVQPAQARSYFYICNETSARTGFNLYDWDENTYTSYSISAGKCGEYWGYESIGFYNNYGTWKEYWVHNNNVYSFDYRRNGAVDIFVY
jgi:hypothetical protein